jgi:hypothetical protein
LDMTALPLGLRSRNAISRQIGKSANAILVMAVTCKNESKKSRERHGSGQSGHHSGRTNCRMSTLRHQPNPNAPVGPRLVGSMLTQWSRIRLRRCLRQGPGTTDGRDEEPRPVARQTGRGCLVLVLFECREGSLSRVGGWAIPRIMDNDVRPPTFPVSNHGHFQRVTDGDFGADSQTRARRTRPAN